MSHLDKTGLERVRQHIVAMSSNKANKITLEDGTVMDLQDVYDAIQENGSGGSTSGGEGNNSTIIGGSENAIATGDNSVVIGESGTAAGDAAIAGGTNNPDIIKNLTWTTSSTEPSELPPADAQGNASIAIGAGTTTYTTGSVAIGTGAKAGAKGFYWYDYETTGTQVEIADGTEITQEHIDNGIFLYKCEHQGVGLYSEDTYSEIFDYATRINYKTNDDGTIIEKVEFTQDALGKPLYMDYWDNSGGCDHSIIPYLYMIQSTGVKIRLSLTQPRISYNPEGENGEYISGAQLEDGTWPQRRTWSDEAQTLLEGWNPVEETDEETNFAVISFYGGHKHTNCSKVLEVLENGYIIVDNLPDPWESSDGVPVTTIQWDEYLIFVPNRPEAGVIEAALGSFAIGLETAASGMASFAQGFGSHAAGSYAVATGLSTEAVYASLSSGQNTKALDLFTLAAGNGSRALARQATALGHNTTASGESSAALNSRTIASGNYATSMGRYSEAKGVASLAMGNRAYAQGEYSFVSGKYNLKDTNNEYAHIVGNGKAGTTAEPDKNRSNAYTLDWDGNGWFAGDIRIGGTNYANAKIVATKDDIPTVSFVKRGTGTSAVVLDVSSVGDSYLNTSNGKASVAIGRKCTAGGDNSTKTDSFAGGYNCKATFGKDFAYGQNLTTTNTHQFLVGRYCDTIPTNALFVVGTGTSSSDKSNGFIVDTRGNGIFAGTISCADSGTATLELYDENDELVDTLKVVVSQ